MKTFEMSKIRRVLGRLEEITSFTVQVNGVEMQVHRRWSRYATNRRIEFRYADQPLPQGCVLATGEEFSLLIQPGTVQKPVIPSEIVPDSYYPTVGCWIGGLIPSSWLKDTWEMIAGYGLGMPDLSEALINCFVIAPRLAGFWRYGPYAGDWRPVFFGADRGNIPLRIPSENVIEQRYCDSDKSFRMVVIREIPQSFPMWPYGGRIGKWIALQDENFDYPQVDDENITTPVHPLPMVAVYFGSENLPVAAATIGYGGRIEGPDGPIDIPGISDLKPADRAVALFGSPYFSIPRYYDNAKVLWKPAESWE